MADDETPWYRPVLAGLAALLAVSLLVGGLVSLVALGTVKFVGGGDVEPEAEARPSLYIPERTPGADDEDDDPGLTLEDLNPDAAGSPTSSPVPSPTADRSPLRRKPRSVISLSASPVEVAPMESIYLSGTYPGGEGAFLQVQRFEGAWDDFPTSASVSGGTFTTYVRTGRSGVNRFRVVDRSTGKSSNPVTVRVR